MRQAGTGTGNKNVTTPGDGSAQFANAAADLGIEFTPAEPITPTVIWGKSVLPSLSVFIYFLYKASPIIDYYTAIFKEPY